MKVKTRKPLKPKKKPQATRAKAKDMRPPPKHYFRFHVETTSGKPQEIKFPAKVIRAKRDVTIVLTADHVRRSMQLEGVGNTQACTMAVCALAHADKFPHRTEGYIDWQYRRAFVVSRVKNGMPSECYAYEHHHADIAKLNDSPNGQQKLLADLEKNGPRTVNLKACILRKYPPHKSGTRTDGSRSSKPVKMGHRARFAFAKLGAVPA